MFLSRIKVSVVNFPLYFWYDRENEMVDLIIDKSATLPGADPDGHFSRIYNFNSLEKRILKTAENAGFSCEIIECEIDFKSIPDTKHNSHGSRLNNPTRALKMTKI